MPDLIDPQSLQVGQYVSFTCLHPTDHTVYEGEILGKQTYDLAKTMEDDLIPYYREVAKVQTTMAPYSTLTYIVLRYTQNDNSSLKVCRALEWIDPASLKILDPGKTFTVNIYNQDMAMVGSDIITLLQANGYICSLGEQST